MTERLSDLEFALIAEIVRREGSIAFEELVHRSDFVTLNHMDGVTPVLLLIGEQGQKWEQRKAEAIAVAGYLTRYHQAQKEAKAGTQ